MEKRVITFSERSRILNIIKTESKTRGMTVEITIDARKLTKIKRTIKIMTSPCHPLVIRSDI